jgi:hypothetical protein
MAHTYTPGLRVTRRATVRKLRQLPLAGKVVVEVDQNVSREQVVATTDLPGDVTTINLVNRLGVSPGELTSYLLKHEGESVKLDEPIAETRPFIKWFKTTVQSPIDGTVESISQVTGQVILRKPPRPVEVHAYVDGIVVETIPNEGVVIETAGAFIQGIFGVGGECWGEILVLSGEAIAVSEVQKRGKSCRGKILVLRGLITLELIDCAKDLGAAGIIGGGIRDQDLRSLLGYDLGVAITGTEDIGITAIVTEGFGDIEMAPRTHEILEEHNGRKASISGATQIRAGVMRPEILIPGEKLDEEKEQAGTNEGLAIGSTMRAIRAPHFGRIGIVSSLPAELQRVESEALVRVLEVTFEDGERAVIPRANVERIEE